MTIRLLLSRDQEGLRRLLADHGGRVRTSLRRELQGLLDPIEVDGALNHAAHQVWTRVTTFDASRGTLRAWFLAVARNCAIGVLRERRRHAVLQFVPALDEHQFDDSPPVARTVGRDRFRSDFYACVDELPRLQRAVLLADLQAGGSAPAEELARDLHTSVNSIYVSRTNGRKVLRARMAELGHV